MGKEGEKEGGGRDIILYQTQDGRHQLAELPPSLSPLRHSCFYSYVVCSPVHTHVNYCVSQFIAYLSLHQARDELHQGSRITTITLLVCLFVFVPPAHAQANYTVSPSSLLFSACTKLEMNFIRAAELPFSVGYFVVVFSAIHAHV